MKRTVPFLDLIAPHQEMKEDLAAVFGRALDTGGFIGGPIVESFERDFAEFCDARHCIGVGSGTDALRFALIAAGIGAGDIVVTVPNTFIATTEAISQAGATPVFVDIDEQSYNMDPAKLAEYLRSCVRDASTGILSDPRLGLRVAAVIPVHLYGQPADMDSILTLAEEFNLEVIEDACQAHGAEYFSKKLGRWQKAGSMARAAAFSFYPGKNLGACGEGGAVTTNDAEVAQKIRMLRDHGQAQKYYHNIEGYNGRLDTIQAGILGLKLKKLASWNRKRVERASSYDSLLASQEPDVLRPAQNDSVRPVYHLYVIRTDDRDGLAAYLKENGVFTGIHYPVPLHLQKAYQGMGYGPGSFPVTERVASEILSLPMYPQLTEEDQEYVWRQMAGFFAGRKLAVSA